MTEYTTASPRPRLLRSWPSTTPRSTPCRRAQTVAEDTDVADRRRLGGGQRQQRAHHHAQSRSLHGDPQRDRRPTGVTGNGTASVTITGTAARDQRGAGGPRLYRQPRLQRRRHAHGRDQRRDRHRHRHDRDHCQSSERRPDQHRAGRADRRRGHHPADRRRLGGGHRQQRAHDHAVGRSRHPQCDRRRRASSPATAPPA